ncbi:MOB kinase activator-like [Lachnellula willkommii]|uniref:MOB kinase activator-like n=1 Tax=Lachnellula willkommii TaxID=215461 RepID=A0A559MF23_9HELO|nr:MOB kinase activator-like [Lachnellula willkommii]
MSMQPSSPRLPSPPPPTEIQIGPTSPALGSSASQEPLLEQSVIEANAARRIHPGTKSADMAAGPPLVPLSELDSAFQLQEHLKALHYHYTKPENSDNTIPIDRETAIRIATQPDGVDRALWLYELCRFLINKCNDLIIGFLFDDPPCSATTCPEMRASEWQFLCAVHESPKSCCAIDYCCHTLDWATNIVTSQKIFPSRLSLGAGDATDERGAGVKHLINIFRRLHRIFAHAWFQHRGVFWQVEGHTGLYVLFKTVCDTYDLLPAENYKLPPEAEGLEIIDEPKAKVPSIMKSDENNNLSAVDEDFINVGRANTNTRRHVRSSPSVGSAIHTVLESDEEDPDLTHKLDELNLADEEGAADVPVIVESYEVDGQHDTPEEKTEEKPEPEMEPVEEVEQLAAEHDDTAASAGSWDRMSSESLGEKLPTEDDAKVDASEKTEAKPEEVSAPEPAKSPEEKAEDVPATEEVPETVKDSDVEEEPQEEAAEAKEAEAKEAEE